MTSDRSAVVSLVVVAWFLSGCAAPFRSLPYFVQNDTGTVLNGVRVPLRCPGLLPLDSTATDSEAVHDVPIAASLAGSQVGIPGWNDCQRLIIGNGNSYGPLIGIFANENLAAISRQQFEQPGGMPVAQLYNFSSFKYQVPSIESRYSCLYLRLDTISGRWQAHLRWMDDVDDCPQLADWPSGGQPLEVVASPPPTGGAGYAAVARWDWDTLHHRNYMAVSCLDQWCEIGARPLSTSVTPGGTARGRAKPELDAQRLAVPDHEKKIWPRVSARITPQPGIDTLDTADFTCPDPCADDAGWVHMATVRLDAPPIDHYSTKMGFTDGDNQVYVRRKTRPGQAVWQTRIISALGGISYRRTLYVAHRSNVPPTVRFRWKEDDETAWMRCLPGCCESSDRAIRASDW